MELRQTKTTTKATIFSEKPVFNDDETVQQRLNKLLALNAEAARQKSMFRSEQERLEAETMRNPLSLEKAFAYFGLMLGTLPPLAFFFRILLDSSVVSLWFVGIMLIVTLITAVVGFFSGQFLAKIIRRIENLSWSAMIFILPFIGLMWGILTGAAGGFIILIIGALFGALIGGSVGLFALPVFTIFHRLLKKGEMIERNHFLPIAFGIVCTISAFILGL